MDNLLIGALELSDQPENFGDGILVSVARANAGPTAVVRVGGCAGDGALEAAANAGPGPTVAVTNCFPATRLFCMPDNSPGANP